MTYGSRQEIRSAAAAPFVCGGRGQLLDLYENSGTPHASVTRHDGPVRFASIDALVSAERACAWTLGGLLDSWQFERLRSEAEEVFQPFVSGNGEVTFNVPVLIITV